MNDLPVAPPATDGAAETPPSPTTAGDLLRQARQARGLHIGALAAAIKVGSRKLELLEANQFDQLPDATFTRALAHTVCRALKVDAAPILALLPPLKGVRLEEVAVGLNTPFHERPGRLVPKEWATVASPARLREPLLTAAQVSTWPSIGSAAARSTQSFSVVDRAFIGRPPSFTAERTPLTSWR